MKKLVFATNNNHKLEEVKAKLGNSFNVLSLSDISCFDEVPETGHTLEANSLEKAQYIYSKYGLDCFADDTGLEVDFLNGRPGVYSARYAGETKDPVANMNKILDELKGVKNRGAKFRCMITLILSGEIFQFEGIVLGTILESPRGKEGFGYDPVFCPDRYDLSFAELPLSEKNKISHRALAVEKLVEFLKSR